ncbi:otoferlin-like [Leptidea sinapis]|uniref:otoferlin-like n=1 Tax=Leptidea sinapis TaxID=189913 RepID=UPI0021C365E9|nr:otoferlin-like [Leptidea sinapis]
MPSNAEERVRQKAGWLARPACRIQNEYNPEAVSQYFQISVSIIEARQLAWSNAQSASSFVIVLLGKKKHRTTLRKNMANPLYNETFIFEMYASLSVLQQSSLWFGVMEPKCCATTRLIGETTVNLGIVWLQPKHQIYQKWTQLSVPHEPSAAIYGFLKIDVSILLKGEIRDMASIIRCEKFEDNLQPSNPEQQRAKYTLTIYGAFGVPCGSHSPGDRRHSKAPSCYIRVSFCDLVAKTSVQQRTINPIFNEEVSIVELFPNNCQTVFIEVISTDMGYNQIIGSTKLKMEDISHDGENGFIPCFGPSLLHIYSSSNYGNMDHDSGPYYRGCLHVGFNTIVPYYQEELRSVSVEPAESIQAEQVWQLENYCVYSQILEASMLDRNVTGKSCGVALTFGDTLTTNNADEEFIALMNITRSRKYHYSGCLNVVKAEPYGYLDFGGVFPVLQFVSCLPDFRFRTYRNNMLQRIVDNMDNTLCKVERQLKSYEYKTPRDLIEKIKVAYKTAASSIEYYLDVVENAETAYFKRDNDNAQQKYCTELDRKQINLQRDEIRKIYDQLPRKWENNSMQKCGHDEIINSRKSVKVMLNNMRRITKNINNIKLHGWPDLVIWLLNEGSRVAYCKILTDDILYSAILEQSGKMCGKIHTHYMKPLKCPIHGNSNTTSCDCVAGRVEMMIWFGLHRDRSAFEQFLPEGYNLKIKENDISVRCSSVIVLFRAFLYKAKITRSSISEKTLNVFVRVYIINGTLESQVQSNTSVPVFNQVLKLKKIVHMTPERLIQHPPIATVELYHCDPTGKLELLGRLDAKCVIENRQGYEFAPMLQWHNLYKGVECTGQILMSCQMIQPNSPTEDNSEVGDSKDNTDFTGTFEPLPRSLVPNSTTYKIEVYWWGLREVNFTRKPCVILDVEGTTLKSDIINDKGGNSNFPNGWTSQMFDAPLSNAYCPVLNVQLYDSTTFGRSLFVGTNVVKNPFKYLVKWLPKQEREASLHCVSVTLSDFIQATSALYIKPSKNKQKLSKNDVRTDDNKKYISPLGRRNKWSSLFCKGEPDEEEYTLLPLLYDQNKMIQHSSNTTAYEQNDWWSRYLYSQKDYLDDDNLNSTDKLTIYETELENQPQFSKFKDWCSSLKLYSSQKIGEPESDKELFCGLLKFGLAIYKWPPPPNTFAVSFSGADLNHGYFSGHPKNNPENFLIRVYIVKATNLRSIEYCGKSDPYVVVSCGKRHLGNRTDYQSCTVNPIFGKMYELRSNLPEDYLVTVSLYDHNSISHDELIGSTTIDIEDRIYSKHRALVGLANEYTLIEPKRWRDIKKPSEILEDICSKNNIPSPKYPDNATVHLNGVEYKDDQKDNIFTSTTKRRENICLNILQNWHTMPICGYYLVPEHVETRRLYHCEKPGVEQGKVVMWIDVFPLDSSLPIPPPVNITARKIEDYELRIIIYAVRAKFDGDFAGKKVKNFFIKTWLGSSEMVQRSDVHYNCDMRGGKINWRMIFNFQYRYAERKLLIRDKRPFTEYEESQPPILVIQLMDCDTDSSDNNCLGSLSLNLNDMPQGVLRSSSCLPENINKMKKIDLFSVGSIRGWWPLQTMNSRGTILPAGLIELDMKLLPLEKSILMPVGIGRQGPSSLSEPCDPASWSNPLLKMVKCVGTICKSIKSKATIKVIIIFLILVLTMYSLYYFCYDMLSIFDDETDNVYQYN